MSRWRSASWPPRSSCGGTAWSTAWPRACPCQMASTVCCCAMPCCAASTLTLRRRRRGGGVAGSDGGTASDDSMQDSMAQHEPVVPPGTRAVRMPEVVGPAGIHSTAGTADTAGAAVSGVGSEDGISAQIYRLLESLSDDPSFIDTMSAPLADAQLDDQEQGDYDMDVDSVAGSVTAAAGLGSLSEINVAASEGVLAGYRPGAGSNLDLLEELFGSMDLLDSEAEFCAPLPRPRCMHQDLLSCSQ
eukprot:jgi/Ulvmu1/8444/UM043_0022.1